MKYVTKNCEVRTFNVTLYDKAARMMVNHEFSDDSNMTERQIEKAASEMFNAKVVDIELVSTMKGIHRISNQRFVELADIVEKARPGCVNRNIAVTQYTLYVYDKASKVVTEHNFEDFDEREQERIVKDFNKVLKDNGDSRIVVDIEPVGASEALRSVPLSVFMNNAEKVETA